MANLPAGFMPTVIDGLRCTAIPRSLTSLTGSLAFQAATFTISTTSVSSTQVPTITAAEIETTASTTSSSPLPPPPQSPLSSPATEAAPQIMTMPSQTPTFAPNLLSASSVTDLLSTAISVLPSSLPSSFPSSIASTAEIQPLPVPSTSLSNPNFISLSSSVPAPTLFQSSEGNGSTSSFPSQTSAPTATVTNGSPESPPAAVVESTTAPPMSAVTIAGSVVGSLALVGILALILWFLRRSRSDRDSLLTPSPPPVSSYDPGSATTEKPGRSSVLKEDMIYQAYRIKAGLTGIGASVKLKITGSRNKSFKSPHAALSQHSRSNSVFSTSSAAEEATLKEKAYNFYRCLRENAGFSWRFGKVKGLAIPFTKASRISEKPAMMNGNQPDFSNFLGMDERQFQEQASNRRASLVADPNFMTASSYLGLDFSRQEDPFTDPIQSTNSNYPTRKTKDANQKNPFDDPVRRPSISIPKSSTYIADIRRSRGQTVDGFPLVGSRPPSIEPSSRYPSVAITRDSYSSTLYRDTMYSSFSSDVRKGKGRSDPFNLERPDWGYGSTASSDKFSESLLSHGILQQHENQNQNQNQERIPSPDNWTRKYNPGISILNANELGDPGPDLGPGKAIK